MLDNLTLNNFHSSFEADYVAKGAFVLKTCQRTMVLDHQVGGLASADSHKHGKEAYLYLLEVICGLQSKLIGENEIVNQFKTTYQQYTANPSRKNELMAILEKLFKDAKEIRSKHLLGLSQKTYASIARKKMLSHYKAEEVLVLGSGQLAEDLINQFKKKAKVFISARNLEKAAKLADQHDLHILPWNNQYLYLDFPFIANTVGFEGVLLSDHFFNKWSEKHENKFFIDLGTPSCIDTGLDLASGVMRLEDVFNEGAILESHKLSQIENARSAMTKLTEKRYIHLQEKQRMRLNLGGYSESQVTI